MAQPTGRHGRLSLPVAFGRFLASTHHEGGLQSIPLVDDQDDVSGLGCVLTAIASTQADRVAGITPPGRSIKAVARSAADEIRRRQEWSKHIKVVVDAAPPLTTEQIAQLRELFELGRQGDRVKTVQQTVQELSKLVRGGAYRIVGGTGAVRLWWDDQADFGWLLNEEEMAARFKASPFADCELSRYSPSHR